MEQQSVDLIIIDSIAAVETKLQLEGEFDSDSGTQKGSQSQVMAQFLTKITKMISKGRKPALLLLNQMRASFSMGRYSRNNDPETPAGGNALRHYTSMRFKLETVKNEGEEGRGRKGADQLYTSNLVRVTCVKNKMAPPWVRGLMTIHFGTGIDHIANLASLAEEHLGVMKAGGYFNFDTRSGNHKFRGRDSFIDLLRNDPDVRSELEERLRVFSKERIPSPVSASDQDEDVGTVTEITMEAGE